VQALKQGIVVSTTRTDSTGEFRLALAPGTYTIVATNSGGFQSTAESDVSIRAGQTKKVNLIVDTGIR